VELIKMEKSNLDKYSLLILDSEHLQEFIKEVHSEEEIIKECEKVILRRKLAGSQIPQWSVNNNV
jgi:sulfur transfer protein SufE